MKTFMDQDFILNTETAKNLYHGYAKNMPIIDYHCHLNPKDIAENISYDNITQVWLYGDHYKWRAMRSFGISEDYITGDRSDKEKFMAFAKMIPYAIGNPLYHWCHLELQRYFDIHEIICEENSEIIWKKANEQLQNGTFSARYLIEKSKVKLICTTDDPIDDLIYHQQIADDKSFDTKVLPTFRPDKSVNLERETFIPWIHTLEKVVGVEISSMDALLKALESRIDFFHENGCRLSDHAMDKVEYCSSTDLGDDYDDVDTACEEALKKALAGEQIDLKLQEIYKGQLLRFFGKAYAKRGWVMQLHIGALRDNNTRMYKQLGADIGFDSIEDTNFATKLSTFLGDLDDTNELSKTILYTLNPSYNYVLGTMIGNFQGDGIKGKIQFGSGWWFNDQKDGMEEQMKALSNLGLLSCFVGMLTDSRSFLSYTRHEYFRRILCNYLGDLVENGEYPNDMQQLGKIVEDISYNNSKDYFGIL
jgi:glucuronate isomerase